MMFKRTQILTHLLAAFGGVASLAAQAQDAPPAPDVQRVEVTGSSIKRIAAEASLPVQTLSHEDILRTGAVSTTDLLQNMSVMQGFTTASQSVNGGGGGATTASVHGIGSAYTLVLLNGRRLAPFTTGSDVNLNAIPLAAIDRVEVLTDGASTVYGSDAIAGVVNFITKKDSTAGEISITGYKPQHPGGASMTSTLSKGFGDLDRDHFNVLLAAGFDKQQELNANQRPFSKTGILTFNDIYGAQEVDLVSSNSVPGNAIVFVDTGDGTPHRVAFSPYKAKNGDCPAPLIDFGAPRCYFDYPSTVQSIPSYTRASLYGSGRLQIGSATSLFTEVAYSHFFTDSRYAPPAQPLTINDALIAKDITPYLGQFGYDGATVITGGGPSGTVPFPTMNVRLYDAGGRMDRYQTDTLHAVIGGDFTIGPVDFTTTYTHSQNKFTDKAESGYTSNNALNALIANGSFDPLMNTAGTATDVLAPAVLHETLDASKSSIDLFGAHGSATLAKLQGGDMAMSVGGEFNHQRYVDDPSLILQSKGDQIVGGGGGVLPFDSKRNSVGLYSELVLPVSKMLELDLSARWDSYTAVTNTANFDTDGNPLADATQGRKNSAGTWKISGRLQPTKDFLLRASIGTGFKAPALSNITQPLQSAGSTGFHDCPPGLSPGKAAYCQPDTYEYNTQVSGNAATDNSGGIPALRPEHSTQWTLGFRVEPSAAFSVGVDLWSVRLKDQIGTVTEDTAFGDGATYDYLFHVVNDPISGAPTLTFLQVPVNLGKAVYQGIDIDASAGTNTPFGRLRGRAQFTYMLRADYQNPGQEGYQNDINKIGADGQVTFQWQANISATLDSGPWSNTLAAEFKPGYKDDYTDYCYNSPGGFDPDLACGPDNGNRQVGNWHTFDWQTRYAVTTSLGLTFGIKNLFDHKPPFTINDQAGTGNARGFDGRYADPIGRQFYLGASYKF